MFDANDFDETLRGPWEWDLKRLAASFMIAGQHLGFTALDCRVVTAHCVCTYRTAMRLFADMGYVDLWYDHLNVHDLQFTGAVEPAEFEKRLARFERRARSKTSLDALHRLGVSVDGHYQIRSDPPVLFSLRDLPAEYDGPTLETVTYRAFESYRATLNDDRRHLLDRYTPIDVGIKVVGVGSVGTRCLIILLQGRDPDDPLFLQAKEANPSVLEEHLEPSPYDNQGRRVVEGQRMIQAQSDLFLGWTQGEEGRQFYIRQLRDWKGSVEIEGATPNQLRFYAGLCGRTLARGHARSGDPSRSGRMPAGSTTSIAPFASSRRRTPRRTSRTTTRSSQLSKRAASRQPCPPESAVDPPPCPAAPLLSSRSQVSRTSRPVWRQRLPSPHLNGPAPPARRRPEPEASGTTRRSRRRSGR